MTPTREHAVRILDLLRHGLVAGLGQPFPGKMCVEAAVCYALDLPHGDNPPCVGSEVRNMKIVLNDQKWSSPTARALGMRRLAIAQLGSDTIDQKAFRDLFWFKCGTQIQPLIRRYLATRERLYENLAFATRMEGSQTLEECLSHARAHAYGYDYGYGYGVDTFLTKVANIATETLQELNSPGCQWLDLCDTEVPV